MRAPVPDNFRSLIAILNDCEREDRARRVWTGPCGAALCRPKFEPFQALVVRADVGFVAIGVVLNRSLRSRLYRLRGVLAPLC